MRSLSTAICTSGLPVSLSWVRNRVMTSCLRSLANTEAGDAPIICSSPLSLSSRVTWTSFLHKRGPDKRTPAKLLPSLNGQSLRIHCGSDSSTAPNSPSRRARMDARRIRRNALFAGRRLHYPGPAHEQADGRSTEHPHPACIRYRRRAVRLHRRPHRSHTSPHAEHPHLFGLLLCQWEIGRASCRERVYKWAVAGALKTKSKEPEGGSVVNSEKGRRGETRQVEPR